MSCRSTRNTAGCIQYWGNCTYIFFAELTAGLGARIYLRYVCIHLQNSCAEQHIWIARHSLDIFLGPKLSFVTVLISALAPEDCSI
jgi:hypothetical protein